MKEVDKIKSDGFTEGLTERSEECAWCGKKIHQYTKCYYGGSRVGNVIICGKCGDEASDAEDDAIYRN